MPTLTEQVTLALKRVADEEAARQQAVAKQNQDNYDTAYTRLQTLIEENFGITPRLINAHVAKPYSEYGYSSGEHYYFIAMVEDLWFGIQTGHYDPYEWIKTADISHLDPFVVCPNRHIVEQLFHASGTPWDTALALVATKQSSLTEGSCRQCVKNNLQRSFKQQVLDKVQTGNRDTARAIVNTLVKNASDEQLLAALKAADSVY